MSDAFESADPIDDVEDHVSLLPVIVPDAAALAEEQAEDDFDFDFDDDFAEEFADEWEPATAAAEVVESVDEDGAVSFVVEDPADID
jgi:hypothetical protein